MVSALVLAVGVATHPLHSSLTTVAWRPETRTVELAMRVFTQDLADALAHRTGTPCRYVQAALSLRDATGHAIPIARCSIDKADDVTWIRLSATVDDPRGLRLSNAVLFELFADQINIVQSSIGGRSRTVLFTRGDGLKPLT